MNQKIPRGAAMLLYFIYRTETGHEPPQCYETIYAHSERILPKKLTELTLLELQRGQKTRWGGKVRSSASGAAQFMYTTLGELIDELKLDIHQKFTGDLQDQLAYVLLKRRGYLKFVSGKMSLNEFALGLAKEWASFPVLTDCQGNERRVKRGQSYYAGDGLNKALVTPESVMTVLKAVYERENTNPKTQAPILTVDELSEQAVEEAMGDVTDAIVDRVTDKVTEEVLQTTQRRVTGPLTLGASIVLAALTIANWFYDLKDAACSTSFLSWICGG